MNLRQETVINALQAALRIRKRHSIEPWQAIDVFRLAEQEGIEVRFCEIPIMEGLLINHAHPEILVSSLRPTGRQAYTCAHEIGHHIFKDGNSIDFAVEESLTKNTSDIQEFSADCFAGYLLMPKSAVDRAFSKRGWIPQSCSPEQIFIVSGWLNVGYSTLIKHLCYVLRSLSRQKAETLLRIQLKDIRSNYLGRPITENLLIVDRFWTDRPLDIQVADFLCCPKDFSFKGPCLIPDFNSGAVNIFRGKAPGIGILSHSPTGWSSFVRVSRRNYVGLNRYRHLEDDEDA